eukprot:g41564.t1
MKHAILFSSSCPLPGTQKSTTNYLDLSKWPNKPGQEVEILVERAVSVVGMCRPQLFIVWTKGDGWTKKMPLLDRRAHSLHHPQIQAENCCTSTIRSRNRVTYNQYNRQIVQQVYGCRFTGCRLRHLPCKFGTTSPKKFRVEEQIDTNR